MVVNPGSEPCRGQHRSSSALGRRTLWSIQSGTLSYSYNTVRV